MYYRIRWANSMAIEPECFDTAEEAAEWATKNFGPSCEEWQWYVSRE